MSQFANPMANLVRAIGTRMASLFPEVGARVVFAPERFEPAMYGPSIVVSHQDGIGDVYSPARAQHSNPRTLWWKETKLQALIVGRSELPGASTEHHQAIVEAACDAFVIALLVDAHALGYVVGSVNGGFRYSPDDPIEASAIYDLQFAVSRAVNKPVLDTSTATPDLSVTVDATDTAVPSVEP